MLTCPKVAHLVMEGLKHRPNGPNSPDLKVDTSMYITITKCRRQIEFLKKLEEQCLPQETKKNILYITAKIWKQLKYPLKDN